MLGGLVAAERQQLPGKLGGAFGGILDFEQILLDGVVTLGFHEQHTAEPQDGLENIIEGMRNAAGQPPDRLHLLGMPILPLQTQLPRHIPFNAHIIHNGPGVIHDGRYRGVFDDNLSVLPAVMHLPCPCAS